jgi:hypothetical protein
MNTRTKLLTAAGGVLLLAGSGTALALWSDTTEGDSLLAATGHLDINIADDSAHIWDVSPLCQPSFTTGTNDIVWQNCAVDGGTPAPLTKSATDDTMLLGTTKFLMVPGDTIRVIAPVDVKLAGQNIAATLTANLVPPEDSENGRDYDGYAVTLVDGVPLDQFTVTPIGVYGSYALDNDANATAALTASISATPAALTYNFIGSDVDQFVYAVIDIKFNDLGVLPYDLTTVDVGGSYDPTLGKEQTLVGGGLNDNNGITNEDLMDNGVGSIDPVVLIHRLNAQLVQVRS